ncbi:MAG: ParA family protein [Chloroflexota bacterium]
MRTIAFFNNKGGVEKTTLVYHLASMIAEQGETVLAVDLDPQANLTSMFLSEDQLEAIWDNGQHQTVHTALRPIIRGTGDVLSPEPVAVNDRLSLIVGDLALSTFGDRLSDAWPRCHNGDEAAYRTMSVFHRMIQQAAASLGADWIVVDVGPNLGAINRAALLSTDQIVIPLGPDLFSLQGLRNLGPSLRRWRQTWGELYRKNPDPGLDLPTGRIAPLGYVVMQHGIRDNRPPKAYSKWIERFPGEYRVSVLESPPDDSVTSATDPYCLATLGHYRSLLPMATEARKPVFALKPADGAIGAHGLAVRTSFDEFAALMTRIANASDDDARAAARPEHREAQRALTP